MTSDFRASMRFTVLAVACWLALAMLAGNLNCSAAEAMDEAEVSEKVLEVAERLDEALRLRDEEDYEQSLVEFDAAAKIAGEVEQGLSPEAPSFSTIIQLLSGIHLNAASSLDDLERHQEAAERLRTGISYGRRWIEFEPDSALAWKMLASAQGLLATQLDDLGDKKQAAVECDVALESCERALKFDPSDKTVERMGKWLRLFRKSLP